MLFSKIENSVGHSTSLTYPVSTAGVQHMLSVKVALQGKRAGERCTERRSVPSTFAVALIVRGLGRRSGYMMLYGGAARIVTRHASSSEPSLHIGIIVVH